MDKNMKPKKSDNLMHRMLEDGSIFLFNPDTGEVIKLNEDGVLVWDCCDGSRTVDEIIDTISKKLMKKKNQKLESTIINYIDTLKKMKIIQV